MLFQNWTGLTVALAIGAGVLALRLLPVPTFGVLLALSPAIAAAVGFTVLGEHLGLRQLCAITLIVTASAWAIRTHNPPGAVRTTR